LLQDCLNAEPKLKWNPAARQTHLLWYWMYGFKAAQVSCSTNWPLGELLRRHLRNVRNG
jgi:hypothetical protein